MIIVKTGVWQYLGVLLFILGSSSIFKMLVKTLKIMERNICKNIVKLNLEQNIKSLLYNHLVYICEEKTDF